jgi:hypothetical protein
LLLVLVLALMLLRALVEQGDWSKGGEVWTWRRTMKGLWAVRELQQDPLAGSWYGPHEGQWERSGTQRGDHVGRLVLVVVVVVPVCLGGHASHTDPCLCRARGGHSVRHL